MREEDRRRTNLQKVCQPIRGSGPVVFPLFRVVNSGRTATSSQSLPITPRRRRTAPRPPLLKPVFGQASSHQTNKKRSASARP